MPASSSASASIRRSRHWSACSRQMPPHLPERLPALRLGLGRHQVGEPLDRGEIHAAVLERAAGELAGLGVAEAFELRERRQRRGDHRAAAVDLQLGDVLAGLALRRREPERQAFVDDLAGGRIAHPRQRRPPRLRHAADHALERDTRPRARDADHRDRRRRPAGGEGEDGVALGGHRRSP